MSKFEGGGSDAKCHWVNFLVVVMFNSLVTFTASTLSFSSLHFFFYEQPVASVDYFRGLLNSPKLFVTLGNFTHSAIAEKSHLPGWVTRQPIYLRLYNPESRPLGHCLVILLLMFNLMVSQLCYFFMLQSFSVLLSIMLNSVSTSASSTSVFAPPLPLSGMLNSVFTLSPLWCSV